MSRRPLVLDRFFFFVFQTLSMMKTDMQGIYEKVFHLMSCCCFCKAQKPFFGRTTSSFRNLSDLKQKCQNANDCKTKKSYGMLWISPKDSVLHPVPVLPVPTRSITWALLLRGASESNQPPTGGFRGGGWTWRPPPNFFQERYKWVTLLLTLNFLKLPTSTYKEQHFLNSR